MSNRLGGKQGTAYLGTNANQPPNYIFSDRAPTQQDTDHSLGDFWLDKTNEEIWVLVSLAGNMTSKGSLATWIMIGSTVSSFSLTGNFGGLVPSDMSGNINLVGDITTAVTTGDPGTNTITITTGDEVATIYNADSGSAVPSAGELEVKGFLGRNITTDASFSTVSISVSGTTNHAVQVGNLPGALTSLAVGTDGQVLIGATGADPAFATLTSTGGSISFTPGANTLNLEAAATVPLQFDTDSGSAVPAANILEILGDGDITTTGAGNTVTINLPDFSALPWTPALSFGGASVGITYAVQEGSYQSLGNLVFFSGGIALTSKGTSVGTARIGGLPFASSGVFQTQMGVMAINDVTLGGGGQTYAWCLNDIGTTSLLMSGGGSGASQTLLNDTNFTDVSQFTVSGFYFRS